MLVSLNSICVSGAGGVHKIERCVIDLDSLAREANRRSDIVQCYFYVIYILCSYFLPCSMTSRSSLAMS